MKIHLVGDGRIDRHDDAISRITQFCICAYKRFLVSPAISELPQTRRCNPWKCEVQIIKNYLHEELSSGFNSGCGSWLSVRRLLLTIRVSDRSYISSVSKASVSMCFNVVLIKLECMKSYSTALFGVVPCAIYEAGNNSAPTGRLVINLDIGVFFRIYWFSDRAS
jgi:hypothetical protein